MDKKVQSYETIFVVDTTKGDEVVKTVVEKFTALISANGEITQVNDWGKRKLAYPINDRTEGYYTLVYFNSEPSFASELERLYNINENVLRALVLKEDEKVKHASADAPAAVEEEEETEEASEEAEPAEEATKEEAVEEETAEEEPTAEEAPAEEPAEESAAEEEPAEEKVEETAPDAE